jgi:hypothetical protein
MNPLFSKRSSLPIRYALLATVAVSLMPCASYATRLIFEQSNGIALNSTHLDANLNPNYGDRVTNTPQDGYNYDLTAGPTPAIVARYGTGTTSDFKGWPGDYGDLVNVIYPYYPSITVKVIDFKLTADPGSAVGLHSFQMAAWTHDYAIVSVKVLNESNAQLYSQGNVLIQGDAVGPRHTDFNFGSPLVGQSLTIRIDATNLGPAFVNIGLDNVVFSQVPEPASIVLLLFGCLGIAFVRVNKV